MMSSLFAIIFTMRIYQLILKEIRRLTDVVKQNTIAKASLAIAIVLAIRKLLLLFRMTAREAKVIEETISSFYDRLSANKLKNVTIWSDSIRYQDVS